MIAMLQTGPPLVIVSSSMMAALLDEIVHIKCSATDGNPDQHNFTLFMNNIQLMASIQSNSLRVPLVYTLVL